jgi:hypothetical protein
MSDLPPTETKKLVVPSIRSKVPGNNFSHVSSPYMTSFPVPLALIWASHVSCHAKVDVSSVSSRFRMTSRKEGMEPVVMALSLGIVTVGDVACAVKGMAAPSRISLYPSCQSGLAPTQRVSAQYGKALRLSELEATVAGIHEIAVMAALAVSSAHSPSRAKVIITSAVHQSE